MKCITHTSITGEVIGPLYYCKNFGDS